MEPTKLEGQNTPERGNAAGMGSSEAAHIHAITEATDSAVDGLHLPEPPKVEEAPATEPAPIAEETREEAAGFQPQYALYTKPGTLELSPAISDAITKQEPAIAAAYKEKYTGPVKSRMHRLIVGHPVATEPGLHTSVRSYSTLTQIVEVAGKKYFVVYNYPGSDMHRKGDTSCRKAWGEKAWKATEADWRDTFMKRSLIPVTTGSNSRIAILPFVPNISFVDILERFDKSKFQDSYEYGQGFETLESKVAIAQEAAAALKQLHTENRTWGEVIPSNLCVTPDKQILFCDPETPYQEDTPLLEQKARDLFSWCLSVCTALHQSEHKITDYRPVLESLFKAYGDKEVQQFLQEHLADDVSLQKIMRHPMAFAHLKARTTVQSRKQYNEIVAAMRSIVEEKKPQ